MAKTFELKDNILEIRSGGALKFTTDRLLSSIVFRQSGTISVTDYNYQAPIVVKEHPAIVADPEKFFMFTSCNVFGGDINSEFETVNGMGSILLGVYKDIDGYFAGSMILDFVSTNGTLFAKITKNVKDGAKIDWSGINHSSAPSILIQYAIQYCRFASNLVPAPVPTETLTANCLLVGGGAGGGGGTLGMSAGGGGAGEVKEFSTVIAVDKSYNISVGEGGQGGGTYLHDGEGRPGTTTRFFSYTALGGAPGANGSVGGCFIGQGGLGSFGSGGGASGSDQNWFTANKVVGSAVVGQYYSSRRYRISTSTPYISDSPIEGGSAGGSINRPYAGATGALAVNPTLAPGPTNRGGSGRWYNAGGGGGAGGPGGDVALPSNSSRDDPLTNQGGPGGLGYTSSITGTPTIYAAGGSGGTIGATPAASTDSIGGEGGSSTSTAGKDAVVNTGSGGGGKGCTVGELLKPSTITGLVTANSATITGRNATSIFLRLSNTTFLTDLSVGDKVLIDGQVREITNIANNYTATVDKPFNPAITTETALVNLTRSSGSVGGNGSRGILVLKIPTPYLASFSEGVIFEHITSVSGYNIYKVTETQTQYERVKIIK